MFDRFTDYLTACARQMTNQGSSPTHLSTVRACASMRQSLPRAHGVSSSIHSCCRMWDGRRDGWLWSTLTTELTPELELVADVTVDDRPFNVLAAGLEHVGGWKRVVSLISSKQYKKDTLQIWRKMKFTIFYFLIIFITGLWHRVIKDSQLTSNLLNNWAVVICSIAISSPLWSLCWSWGPGG